MDSQDRSLAERVSASFQKLARSAEQLNAVSNELGKSIAALDAALKHLNLGVSTWVATYEDSNPLTGRFHTRGIGYAKVNGKWGIALRTIDGDYTNPGFEDSEEWPFNDAPRSQRIEAVAKLPDLIEKLVEVAASVTDEISTKIKDAEQVAAGIKLAVNTKSKK
jgi:hypothetical protein